MTTQRATLRIFVMLLAVVIAPLLTGCGAGSKVQPPMPIEVKHRPSLLGQGYVVTIKNVSDQELKVNVRLTRGFKKFKEGELTVPAGAERQLGWVQGVALKQGDRISVEHPGFATWNGNIPKSFDN